MILGATLRMPRMAKDNDDGDEEEMVAVPIIIIIIIIHAEAKGRPAQLWPLVR